MREPSRARSPASCAVVRGHRARRERGPASRRRDAALASVERHATRRSLQAPRRRHRQVRPRRRWRASLDLQRERGQDSASRPRDALRTPARGSSLAEFPAMPSAFVFSPAEAMAERRQERRAARKSKVQPSQAQRDANARRDYADAWTSTTYRHAVEAACKRAAVEVFTPHEVRHAFATWAAAVLGVIAASVALNHRNLSTTQRYVHPDASLAFAAAAAVQRRVLELAFSSGATVPVAWRRARVLARAARLPHRAHARERHGTPH